MSEIPTTDEQPAVEAIRHSTDVAVLVIHGQADLHTAPELRERLHGVIDEGAFHVVVGQPGLRRIFEVTLLDRVFTLFPTRADALDRL